MTSLTVRRKESIDRLEEAMMAHEERIDIESLPLKHFVTDSGLYAREMIIPAGTIVTGKVKLHEHISVISAGFLTEVTTAGLQRIKAPYTMVSAPGTKRVVWAHTDVVWTTIHASEETDIERLEAELFVDAYSDVPGLQEAFKQLELELEV